MRCQVIYDWKDWYFFGVHKFQDRLIVRKTKIAKRFLKPVLSQNFNFLFKNVSVVEIEQFFIGKIDTYLFKAVFLKVLKPKNIQNVDCFR